MNPFDFMLQAPDPIRFRWKPLPSERLLVEHLSPFPLDFVEVVTETLSEAQVLLKAARYEPSKLYLVSAIPDEDATIGTLFPKFDEERLGARPVGRLEAADPGGQSGASRPSKVVVHKKPVPRWFVVMAQKGEVLEFDDRDEAEAVFAAQAGPGVLIQATDARAVRSRFTAP